MWDVNIKIDSREIGEAEDGDQWRILVNTAGAERSFLLVKSSAPSN
jgi:hypothetical protein